MPTTLFHFSEDPTIALFEPRPVRTPAPRPPGQAWLNGPLVWAIDEAHSFLYLFPRECPRILIWPTEQTTPADRARWMGDTKARALAYIEDAWAERMRKATIHRYDLPSKTFEDLNDAGMWVSRKSVKPTATCTLSNLPSHLAAMNVSLRAVEDLTPLRDAWNSTLHASGIRLRNANPKFIIAEAEPVATRGPVG